MKKEWMEDLLKDARKVLDKPVISMHSDAIDIRSLEERSSILLHAFSKSAEIRFFEGACRMTWPLFYWFIKRRINRYLLKKEAESVAASFFGLLCEGLLRPIPNVPFENWFSWGYLTIENMLISDSESIANTPDQASEPDLDRFSPSNSETWLRLRLSDDDRTAESIIEILLTGDADLSSLENDIISLFYGKNLPLKTVASELGISEDHVREIFDLIHAKVHREVLRKVRGISENACDEEERK